MRTSSIATLLLTLPIGGAVFAAESDVDLLACVDPDVRRAFLDLHFPAGQRIVPGIPDEFSRIKFPDYLSPIGTMEMNNRLTVGFAGSKSGVSAVDDIVAVLLEAGWKEQQDTLLFGGGGGGFQMTNTLQFRALCSAENWSTTLRSRQVDSVTYVTVNVPIAPARGQMDACSADTSSMPAGIFDTLHRYLPTLKMPEEATPEPASNQFIIMGSSGGSEHVDTKARFNTQISSEQLAAFFSAQLLDQGWRMDASWTGSVSEGSTWVSATEDEAVLAGELAIYNEGDDAYHLVFTLRKLRSS